MNENTAKQASAALAVMWDPRAGLFRLAEICHVVRTNRTEARAKPPSYLGRGLRVGVKTWRISRKALWTGPPRVTRRPARRFLLRNTASRWAMKNVTSGGLMRNCRNLAKICAALLPAVLALGCNESAPTAPSVSPPNEVLAAK